MASSRSHADWLGVGRKELCRRVVSSGPRRAVSRLRSNNPCRLIPLLPSPYRSRRLDYYSRFFIGRRWWAGSSGHRIYIMAPMIASFLRQGISNLGFVRWDEFVEPLANCDSSLRLIREREGRDEELGVLVEEGKCISKAAWKSVHKGWGSVKVARNAAGGGWLYRSPAWQGQPARNRETVLPPMNADPLSFSSLSLSFSSPTRGDHFFPLKGFFYTEKHPFWLGFCGETILSHVRGDDERRFRYKKLLIFFFFSNAKRRWIRSFFIFCPDFLRKLGW